MDRSARAVVVVLSLAAVTAGALPGGAVVASPTASPAGLASPPPGPTTAGVAWLDAPVPLGAAPGTSITVGAILVEGNSSNLMQFATPAFRLSPATGDAPPSVAIGLPDWRGHFVAHLDVPAAGAGELRIGLPGTLCVNDSCTASDWPFEIRVGPPTGLALPSVTTANLAVADLTLEARATTTVDVDLTPRVAWQEPLRLPDQLFLEVRVVQGPTVAEVRLDHSAGGGGQYAGSLAIDQPGDYVVQVAAAANPADEQLYGTALRRLTVVAASEPAAPAAGPSSGLPDWWPLGLAVVGLALAALLILRGRSAEAPRR